LPTSKERGGEGTEKGRYGKGRGKRKGGGREGEEEREGEAEWTRPHPFTPPLIHISGYAAANTFFHAFTH